MNEVPTTRAEAALILALTHTTSTRAGRITSEYEYPKETPEQRERILEAITRILTTTVLGLRNPGPTVVIGELSTLIEEIAMSVVFSALGDPPAKAQGSVN